MDIHTLLSFKKLFQLITLNVQKCVHSVKAGSPPLWQDTQDLANAWYVLETQLIFVEQMNALCILSIILLTSSFYASLICPDFLVLKVIL